MNTKICSGSKGCGLRLPLSSFYKHRKLGTYGTSCKECLKQISKERYHNVVKLGKDTKKSRTCTSCDTTYKSHLKHVHFDRDTRGSFFPYCNKDGCKKKYHQIQYDTYCRHTSKTSRRNRERRRNIIRAKFIDWQITGVIK